MLVTERRPRNKVASLSIDVNLNGNSIENVTDFKLLGITLDQDVAFDRQIEELSRKLVKRIGFLRHISPYLIRDRREIYYSSIAKPVSLYGSSIWTFCSKENHSIKVTFKPYQTINQIFPKPKDQMDKDETGDPVYDIPCADCSKSCIGETQRKFITRKGEDQKAVARWQGEK